MIFLFTGLTLGFLGSLHCVVMCGGIAGALSVALPPAHRRLPAMLRRHAGFGVGRVVSYMWAGALAGALGALLASVMGPYGSVVLRRAAALLLLAVGLYIGGWSPLVTHLERQGVRVWRHIAPLAGRLRAGHSPWTALALGALWGWLPCGLVYSGLTLAAATGSGLHGATLMAGFGLGTLPAMAGVGLLAERSLRLARGPYARQLAGALMILFAVWTFAASGQPASGGQNAAPCHGDR